MNDPQVFELLPFEVMLKDDCPLYFWYVYIVDGKITRMEEDCDVASYKQRFGAKEIRKCALFGPNRQSAKIGDEIR